MRKSVTVKVTDLDYETLQRISDRENRPMESLVEDALLKYLVEKQLHHDAQMIGITDEDTLARPASRRGRGLRRIDSRIVVVY